ncbi:MAG: single-stranded-DNA-specific exonuclease RecJ [Clostridia bacterium]|nr:single-stranded-DNA-specific exonuclease RecJ [Clostridia bacterium]
MQKKWNINGSRGESTAALAAALGVGTLTAGLLEVRGYGDTESALRFLRMEEEMLHSPMLLRDMDKAVARIAAAVQKHERIVIYGDYDVDGVTSVSILYLYLSAQGADVGYYIPNRMGEGYGMSEGSVDRLCDEGAKLIVTVDTGITSSAEIAHAASRGVDVVVTDHHECHGQLPQACAVVNPRRPDCGYPFKELAGVGVVFKLLCAFESVQHDLPEAEAVRSICRRYADLVAIGTIADVMPIKDENRLIVAYGLRQIEKTERVGLLALLEAVSKKPDGTKNPRMPKITSGFIGYTLAPRINAAGRISSAGQAVELFLTDSREKANEIAARLCDINRERQTEENRIAAEAYAQIEAEHDFERYPVIVLAADNWHHGVIGIVSSRITEKFGLPSILISFDGAQSDGDVDVGKGSGRSVKGLNLVDALVSCGDLLEKYGGHELAAGLSVRRENIDAFRERINDYARAHFSAADRVPTLDADFEISPEEVTLKNAEEIRLLEPYGVSNPTPTFVVRGAKLLEVQSISFGKHTKLMIERAGERPLCAMYFGCSPKDAGVYAGDTVDLLGSIDVNVFNDIRTAQLVVRDVRLCEKDAQDFRILQTRYAQIKGGAPFDEGENVLPSHEEFGTVFRFISRQVRYDEDSFSVREMLMRDREIHAIGYLKLRVILQVFLELNIVGMEELAPEVYRFKLYTQQKKADLDKSTFLRKLRGQMTR